MAAVLKWIDDVVGARETPGPTFELRLVSHRMTAAELIRRRVESEVERSERDPEGNVSRLVEPTSAERALNGTRPRKRREIDVEEQVEVALEAFRTNGFFLLFDDRQVTSLDEELVVTADSLARFVRLMPLVGG
ncbi:MAG: hypothetical protein AAGM22_25500 [Acidobacteriota bacterium]